DPLTVGRCRPALGGDEQDALDAERLQRLAQPLDLAGAEEDLLGVAGVRPSHEVSMPVRQPTPSNRSLPNSAPSAREAPALMNHSVPNAIANPSGGIFMKNDSSEIWLACASIDCRLRSICPLTSMAWVMIASGDPKSSLFAARSSIWARSSSLSPLSA